MAIKYLVSANGQDHLPVTGEDGKPDHRLMGAAWAALHGGYRGNKYEGPNKQAAIDKLKAMYKAEKMEMPGAGDHGDLGGKWIEIFRTGKHTDSAGTERDFNQADLDDVVRNYNPDYHEAPAVVGHPATDAPAYGWTSALKAEDGKLLAQLKDVDPQFGDMVEQRRFPKRSASFYLTPDGLSLRHIGFLGAQPPAVKGLAAIKFDEQALATGAFDFEEGSMAENQKPIGEQVRESVKEFFASMFGEKRQAGSFSESDAQALIERSLQPLQQQNTDLQRQLEKQKAEFAEREIHLRKGEHSQRISDAVNQLRTAGKWVPAFETRFGLKSVVFAELAKDTETIEFGEGESKRKLTAFDALLEFMEALPRIVPTGEIVKDNVIQFSGAKPSAHTSALPPQSQNSVQLHELTVEYMEKHDKLSYAEALTVIAKKHPELTAPGMAAAGAV